MKLLVATVAALLTLLICGSAQARPDGMAPTEPPADKGSTPTAPPTPASSASHEADIDNSSSGEEENITIQGKAAALCPPRQAEILALEAECAQAEPSDCSTTPAPMVETTETHSHAAVTTTEAAAHSPTTEAPVAATTESATKSGRRQRKRTCNYYLCVMKKLELLDTSDMPNKTLIGNWIANITDEDQKIKTEWKFAECAYSLKDVFGESSENSKSTEEDSTDDKKIEETQPRKKSCVAAKKVISCLFKSVECPVLKF